MEFVKTPNGFSTQLKDGANREYRADIVRVSMPRWRFRVVVDGPEGLLAVSNAGLAADFRGAIGLIRQALELASPVPAPLRAAPAAADLKSATKQGARKGRDQSRPGAGASGDRVHPARVMAVVRVALQNIVASGGGPSAILIASHTLRLLDNPTSAAMASMEAGLAELAP